MASQILPDRLRLVIRTTAVFVVSTAVVVVGARSEVAVAASSVAVEPVEVEKSGFTISLPTSWTTFDSTRQESREAFDAAVAANPELEQFSGLAGEATDATVLQAVGASTAGDAIHFEVQHYPEQLVLDPVSLLRAQLRESGVFRHVQVASLRVAGVRAVNARLDLSLGAGTVAEVMYEVVGSDGMLLFVFAGADRAAVAKQAKATMQTLELAA
jgi:hypothetical protein